MVTSCVRHVICLQSVVRAGPLSSRIGIYAGTFNPVHAGHIAFALQAMERAELDEIYFLPERKPRAKQGVEHLGHRAAMLTRALKPHPSFSLLEMDDISFTVKRTIPALHKRFPEAQLVMIVGSDVVAAIPEWPDVKKMLEDCELVVGVRANDNVHKIERTIDGWPIKPRVSYIFESFAPDVSSRHVREALRTNNPAKGALTSVKRYSDKNWLYVSVGEQ